MRWGGKSIVAIVADSRFTRDLIAPTSVFETVGCVRSTRFYSIRQYAYLLGVWPVKRQQELVSDSGCAWRCVSTAYSNMRVKQLPVMESREPVASCCVLVWSGEGNSRRLWPSDTIRVSVSNPAAPDAPNTALEASSPVVLFSTSSRVIRAEG